MIVFRHVDPRYPFLWVGPAQPEGRWNRDGRGPTHYLADTPDGAWAEFLRHEEIRDPADLPGIRREIWAVEIGDLPTTLPSLEVATMTGGRASYAACQEAADDIRSSGEVGFLAPSAALQPGGAHGYRVDGVLQPGPQRNGLVVVLFGPRPDLNGWQAALGWPDAALLPAVNHF